MSEKKNIFEDLKDMGLDKVNQKELFRSQEQGNKGGAKKYTPEDILYDKTYTCPVCSHSFKAKAIRTGKNHLVTTDIDLKGTYDIVNPLLYECIVCEECGYAALAKAFNRLSINQRKWIKEQISSKYKQVKYPEILSTKEGIVRYKLALLNAQVKNAKDGEKAYICLKIAWLYRDIKNEKRELEFIKNALTGFLSAFTSERFPIFELDELTTSYLIAAMHYRLKNYDEALRWIGPIILNPSVGVRLKIKAEDLKARVVEDKKKGANKDVQNA